MFTAKHHEGFALHDSAVTDYDAGSVLHRDLLKEIVDAGAPPFETVFFEMEKLRQEFAEFQEQVLNQEEEFDPLDFDHGEGAGVL